ncbi:F0F1 ATP synthase subunit gamma [Vineibacter terrae]|uniref:F0F1 ATP synthase subunit gamma n=1 Tax=Vineibacter terrae TaxID=2586908 RepID=UPI002E376A51|nr:F0F1 ATP synthase subunit gamma [Vineibacter terrae]HEX2890133.1 F0F1 ATP synthase subunit gamma [Vineibacter terrae]
MPSLKQYRLRIRSVQSTQKITKAMKMVAAAKLRRAQEAATAARPYATAMDRMMASLAGAMQGKAGAPRLLAGTGADRVHLLIVATADRGLCGGFNSSIVREARRAIRELQADGKTVKILCVGRKSRDQLRRDYSSLIIDTITDLGRPSVTFADATKVASRVVELFDAGEFDVATLFYNRFRSAISQIVTRQQIIPPAVPEQTAPAGAAPYEFEPDEETILKDLLPRNLTVQVYRALLENSASFFGAQMTAMDNATRNAGDMIKKLTLFMNRQRQAGITKELIEIISGAQAV